MRHTLLGMFALVACSKGDRPPPVVTSCSSGNEQACESECTRGDNTSCDLLTSIYLRTKRAPEASALTKRLCLGGRLYFCPSYAFVLAEGEGIAPDRAAARELFARTCQHDAKGCSEYGNLYMSGKTRVPQDLELGSFLLDLACKHGDADACRELQAFQSSQR